MRWSLVVPALLASVAARPGMKAVMEEIEHLAAPQPMIGDLATLADSELSPTGALVKAILLHSAPPQSLDTYTPPSLSSSSCHSDPCCVWSHISTSLHAQFTSPSGHCTAAARSALRLAFHDAGAWDLFSPDGGADGSILLNAAESQRPENAGLAAAVAAARAIHANYTGLGFAISAADLVQVAGNVATVSCPGGPRVRTFVGRHDSAADAPRGKIPSPSAGAAELVELFANKTIGPRGLVALLGAHSVSRQRFVDESRALQPQDATPGVWDTVYFRQTLARQAPRHVFRFESDVNLANYAETRGEFEEFAGQGGQEAWNNDYAREFIRLSLLGVNNINTMTECTKALPLPVQKC
ncbi:hypothetical protein TD95_001557 [Thielaviopsis punctulata]|uniref:Peroxidase n=1 Tax=Thielaviopsis punctulata TaxID=72032 RepID=A0A0F4ZBW6_9PEZI|nr:hypothetical protein TD95_001557 [Thielaviopsis punctulata]